MSDNRTLAVLFGGAILILLVLFAVAQCPSEDWQNLREVHLEGTLAPDLLLSDSHLEPAETAVKSRTVHVYLDVSEPMAGFLRPPESDNVGLRSAALLLPDHFLRIYGPIDEVLWFRVATGVEPFNNSTIPRFSQGEFKGGDTFLDVPAREIIDLLQKGKIEAAAIVTDLVATREVTGSLGLSNALREWLELPAIRSGSFDLGLLGVRITYRGVRNGKCEVTSPGLGCWFSERAKRWRPLENAVDRPVYFLILGRGASEASVPKGSRVQAIGEGLMKSLSELGLESNRWELLTATHRSLSANLQCTVEASEPEGPGKEQFALWLNRSGQYRCQQDDRVLFNCSLAYRQHDPDLTLIDLEVLSAELSWPSPWAKARSSGEETHIEIDCGRLRQEPRRDEFRLIRLEAKRTATDLWSGWSTESDELVDQLDRTLQLAYFIEQMRPRHLVFATDKPFLRDSSQ